MLEGSTPWRAGRRAGARCGVRAGCRATRRRRRWCRREVTHTGTGADRATRSRSGSPTRRRRGCGSRASGRSRRRSDSTRRRRRAAGRLPSQWQPGDFPIAIPNTARANWPVADMVKDDATGVWSYTTPLPSGTFTYSCYQRLRRRGPAADRAARRRRTRPIRRGTRSAASIERSSQVYVPSDPAFGTVDSLAAGARARRAARTRQPSVSYDRRRSRRSPVGKH